MSFYVNDGTHRWSLCFGISGEGIPVGLYYCNSSGYYLLSGVSAIQLNTWHTYTMELVKGATSDQDALYIYVDGSSAGIQVLHRSNTMALTGSTGVYLGDAATAAVNFEARYSKVGLYAGLLPD